MERILRPGLATNAKDAVTQGNLQYNVTKIFSGKGRDSIIMRQVAPWAVEAYLTGHAVDEFCCADYFKLWWHRCVTFCCGQRVPTRIEFARVEDCACEALPPGPSHEDRPAEEGDMRVFGIDVGGEVEPAVEAVRYGPILEQPRIFSDTRKNHEAAIQERQEKKWLMCTLNQEDRKEIGRFVQLACGTYQGKDVRACSEYAMFSRERIREWAYDHLHIDDLRSHKWSEARFRQSLEALSENAFPNFKITCSIKREPMGDKKPPRILLADGDSGQVMALIVVRCMEHLMFKMPHPSAKRTTIANTNPGVQGARGAAVDYPEGWASKSAIKGQPKRVAAERIAARLKGLYGLEADGSAWDACCSWDIRQMVLFPVLDHLITHLCEYAVVPKSWLEAYKRVSSDKQTRLNRKPRIDALFLEKIDLVIAAITRSGAGDTSVGNRWLNDVLNSIAFARNNWKLLDPRTEVVTDRTGADRRVRKAEEGDDQVAGSSEPYGPELMNHVSSFWLRAGYHMKFKNSIGSTYLTFVGFRYALHEGRFTGACMPDLPRLMKKVGLTTSAEARQAYEKGQLDVVRRIGCAMMLSYAHCLAGYTPAISRWFCGCCSRLGEPIMNREVQIVTGFEEGAAIFADIERLNTASEGSDCDMLKAHGLEVSMEELEKFTTYVWMPDDLSIGGTFLDALPESWRS